MPTSDPPRVRWRHPWTLAGIVAGTWLLILAAVLAVVLIGCAIALGEGSRVQVTTDRDAAISVNPPGSGPIRSR